MELYESAVFFLLNGVIYATIIFFIIKLFVQFCSTFLRNLLDRNDGLLTDISNGVYYPISYWTEKGGRPYQEDRVSCLPGKCEIDSSLYGVYDGHGGAKAAQFCKEKLLKYVLEDENFHIDTTKALCHAFRRFLYIIFFILKFLIIWYIYK
jgi:hypothetical protein